MNNEGRELFAQGQPTEQQMRKYTLEVVVTAFRRATADIRALGAPAGDEEEIEDCSGGGGRPGGAGSPQHLRGGWAESSRSPRR
jgi:hypothetical protein